MSTPLELDYNGIYCLWFQILLLYNYKCRPGRCLILPVQSFPICLKWSKANLTTLFQSIVLRWMKDTRQMRSSSKVSTRTVVPCCCDYALNLSPYTTSSIFIWPPPWLRSLNYYILHNCCLLAWTMEISTCFDI